MLGVDGHMGKVPFKELYTIVFALFLQFIKKDNHMNASNLNSAGQACVAVVGSILVNAVVHPLCTIKNRQMANQPPLLSSVGRMSNLKALYKGYAEICATDAASFAVCYIVNGVLKKNEITPLTSAILAGIASSPVVAIGEAFMVNRQVNGHAFDSRMLSNALRASGLFATMLREVPFSVAIFAFAPAVEKAMPFSNKLADSTVAGLIAGGVCGAVTAPADKIKTLVQAHASPLAKTATAVFLELGAPQGQRKFWADAGTRALYVGLAVAILNVLNHRLPHFLPTNMHE